MFVKRCGSDAENRRTATHMRDTLAHTCLLHQVGKVMFSRLGAHFSWPTVFRHFTPSGRLVKRRAGLKRSSYRHLSGALSISNQIKSFPKKCAIIQQLLVCKWRPEYTIYIIYKIYIHMY